MIDLRWVDSSECNYKTNGIIFHVEINDYTQSSSPHFGWVVKNDFFTNMTMETSQTFSELKVDIEEATEEIIQVYKTMKRCKYQSKKEDK